jgi:protein tyrosine phosphatase (PTP) superfamily phosphohydrolase (DUF442 family)
MPDFSFLPAFIEVSPALLTSAQPLSGDFPTLNKQGVQVVINLAAPNSSGYLINEAQLALENGMAYIHMPVVWTAPQESDFAAFTAMLAALQDKVVLVHCALNMRVSAFIYAYRVKIEGENEAVARARMEQIWSPDEIWTVWLKTILAQNDSGPDKRLM